MWQAVSCLSDKQRLEDLSESSNYQSGLEVGERHPVERFTKEMYYEDTSVCSYRGKVAITRSSWYGKPFSISSIL